MALPPELPPLPAMPLMSTASPPAPFSALTFPPQLSASPPPIKTNARNKG
jgi:hypothetical protein